MPRTDRPAGRADRPIDPELLALESLPYGARLSRLREDPRLHRPGMLEALLDRAAMLRFADPRRAFETSVLAQSAADALAASVSPAEAADGSGRSWIGLSEAWRALGDLSAAERALDAARDIMLRGAGALGPATDLTLALSRLRREGGRPDEALELAELALGLSRAIGRGEVRDRPGVEARLERIAALRLLRRLPEARQELDRLDDRLDEGELSPRPAIEAAFLAARIAAELGDAERAARNLNALGRTIEEQGTGLDRLRWAWLHGRVVGESDPAEAERLLRSTVRGFTRFGLLRIAAQVRLDLALQRCRPRASPALYLALEARTATTRTLPPALARASRRERGEVR